MLNKITRTIFSFLLEIAWLTSINYMLAKIKHNRELSGGGGIKPAQQSRSKDPPSLWILHWEPLQVF